MDWNSIALLIFRISYTFVFLNAAWQCGRSKEGIAWTIDESRILFGNAAPIFGIAGIATMAIGGLSVLLGIYGEIGGLMLAAFVLPGAIIHLRKQKESSSLAQEIQQASESEKEKVGQLGILASLGHYSSAMKNFSLFGPGLYFLFAGTGAYSIDRLWRTFS